MKTMIFFRILLLFSLISIGVYSKTIEPQVAEQIGKNFYFKNAGSEKQLGYDEIMLSLFSTKTSNGIPAYHIFNINQNDGFIIVSASDAVMPVIGYTITGKYTGDNVPPGLQGLLDAHAKTISEVVNLKLEPTPEIQTLWKTLMKPEPEPEQVKALAPMLSTTWDQGCSYNDSCPYEPYYHACNHAWAGCGATAMAQILRYFSYPSSGIGFHSYQDEFPNSTGKYTTVKANFAATTYNYSAMSNYLYWPNTDANIAQLTYHCAVAADMDFDTSESVSYMDNILSGLKTRFGYPNGAKWVFMSDTTNWKTKIKNEMLQPPGRPLLYWGADENDNAHFWVCDGYDNAGLFHMNWGVFRYVPNPINFNGYFYISSLAPYSGAPDFSYRQAAIFNLSPYCSASSLTGDSSMIMSVQLNTLQNEQSGSTSWKSYNDNKTQFTTNLSRGSSYGIRVKVRYTFGTQNTLATVFIDWNQDGDFLDTSEAFSLSLSYDFVQFMPAPPKYYGIYEATISVPANAPLGNTPLRMRVVPASYGSNPSCGQTPAGEVEDYLVSVIAGNQPPQPAYPFLFSLDIGSDSELSDQQANGNELFDPGDCYYYDGTILPVGGMDGVVNDRNLVRTDTWSTPGMTGAVIPIGNGSLLSASFFDLDGIDQIYTDLSMFGGNFPVPAFDDSLIFTPNHILISFDDDSPPNWSDTQGSVPINSSSPTQNKIFGTTSAKDEIVEAEFQAGGSGGFPLGMISSGVICDETSLHPQLGPNPDNGNQDDDDVDALDMHSTLPQSTLKTYFTVDHEATYIDPVNQNPMVPSNIYEYFGSSAGVFHFSVAVHFSQINVFPETDVDAFEFVWLWNDQIQSQALAVLFSVDNDDPLTLLDESGNLNPNMLYYSFMDGSNHPFSDEAFDDDIDAISCSGKSFLSQSIPSTWQYTPGGTSHIITIPLNCNPELNGNALASGDLIGVFFNDNTRGEKCGGYITWNGTSNQALFAYGDDIYTPDIKEGFDEGEDFIWKVFSSGEGSDYFAESSYDPMWPEKDGKFYDNGLSALSGLTGFSLHQIFKYGGWSGISSYLDPLNPDLDELFSPYLNELIILSNFGGVYWPDAGINNLNNWDAYAGYVMKLNQDILIDFKGSTLSDNTVLLTAGWNLLPVLSSSNTATTSVLGIPEVVVAKEVAGSNVFWPAQNIYSLYALSPGNAYYVYAESDVVVDFSSKATAIPDVTPASGSITAPPMWHPVLPTPNSHLVIVPSDETGLINDGDFIGAFDSEGQCCGYAQAGSQNIALVIYGDDILTGEKLGMAEEEEIIYKIYKQNDTKDLLINPGFSKDFPNVGSNFITNGLSKIDFKTNMPDEIPASGVWIYPNPVNNSFVISLDETLVECMEIQMTNMLGEVVVNKAFAPGSKHTIDVSHLSTGTYILRLSSTQFTLARKIAVHH
ncbi:MAG: thiol protease/hemagglutinin PrtT [Bacteroidales bacterium]|nr:thiol protease/hemagglutinin PrtT [Bacteroidales bacterium]